MTTLKIGDKAPGFTAKDQYGKTIDLEDFKGKKVVLFFYQKPVHLAVQLKLVI